MSFHFIANYCSKIKIFNSPDFSKKKKHGNICVEQKKTCRKCLNLDAYEDWLTCFYTMELIFFHGDVDVFFQYSVDASTISLKEPLKSFNLWTRMVEIDSLIHKLFIFISFSSEGTCIYTYIYKVMLGFRSMMSISVIA